MSTRRSSRAFRPRLNALETRLVLSGAAIIYVNANIAADSSSAVRDGATWPTAFADLQDALAMAEAVDGPTQIWIAQGTYKPSKVYSPLDSSGSPVVGGAAGLEVANMKTFHLPDEVTLYGGFKHGATSLAKRDPAAYPTILSGDLAGNDVNNTAAPNYAASKADNAWHVVTVGGDVTREGTSAVLDGLQVVNGYANGPNNGGTLEPFIWGHADGGGVYIAWDSHVTINDSLFRYNFAASDGGGVFADSSDLTVTNSRFLDNSALVRGGALEGLHDFENGVSHKTILINSEFARNTSAVFGGAVVGEGAYQGPASMMLISGCTFRDNRAAEGGAIVVDTLTVLVDRSTFLSNTATVNGGVLSTTNVVATIVGAPNDFATTITNSTMIDNVCLADPAAHAKLNDFVGAPGLNFANGGGALVAYMNGYLNVAKCDFIGNRTLNGDGGAILNGDASANLFGISAYTVRTTVTDCNFIGNLAVNGNGGAIASESDRLSAASATASTSLSVTGSNFLANLSAGNGGAMYLRDTVATITGNLFALDLDPRGVGVYAAASQVNGFASSDPQAATSFKKKNVLLLELLRFS